MDEVVQKDLTKVIIGVTNWKRNAKHRKEWRKLVHEAIGLMDGL